MPWDAGWWTGHGHALTRPPGGCGVLPMRFVHAVYTIAIKKADWDMFKNQEEYIKWSMKWVLEAPRILKPTGFLYVCGFSEIGGRARDARLPPGSHSQISAWTRFSDARPLEKHRYRRPWLESRTRIPDVGSRSC